MSDKLVERIAETLLFEGYMLYPYRPTAVKNIQRFNFGVIYPPGSEDTEGADASIMQTECLVEGDSRTVLDVKVRFLHLIDRTFESRVPRASWQEASERSIIVPGASLGELASRSRIVKVNFAANKSSESVPAMDGVSITLRRQEAVDAEIELSAIEASAGLFRVRVQIRNTGPVVDEGNSRDERLLISLVSAHTILTVSNGSFISLLDPPTDLRALAAACQGIRTWPVLVGEPEQHDTMLSSPIIIYDYPTIAPESAGDLFDGTEIDEILSLRILTMTDAEKNEMRQSDSRARRLLERTESLNAEQFMQMHGTMRGLHS